MPKNKINYIIITPAHNEENFIEGTIKSVIYQTVLPLKWYIISDGSSDKTDDIIKLYMKKYNWIEYIRLPEHRDRQFAAKVSAFNAGYEKAKKLNYDIIGNLDADITFEKDYFDFLLNKFIENPKLGVAGTPFVENGINSRHSLSDLNHVSGACQLFRRKCFEEIGGYVPNRAGGIDWIAVTTARMKGWETRTFLDITCEHHRKIGTGRKNNVLVSKFNYGQKDYYLGGHPLWHIFRSSFQLCKKPYIIGGIMLFFGYFFEMFKFKKRPISKELIKFHQSEQLKRIIRLFRK